LSITLSNNEEFHGVFDCDMMIITFTYLRLLSGKAVDLLGFLEQYFADNSANNLSRSGWA
jgi:hypothetical protein